MFLSLLMAAGIIALYVVPLIAFVYLALLARRVFNESSGRTNPLTRDLLRGPGHTLNTVLDDIRGDLLAYTAGAAPVPLLFYALYMGAGGGRHGVMTAPVAVAACAVAFCLFAWKIVGLMRRARDIRLGLEAETAVGQELSQLMREGFHVFHDVEGDGPFNVDHVIVGRSGLYAVETKGRSKPMRGRGSSGASAQRPHEVVVYADRLQFPHRVETEPLEQAQRNAKWLSRWVSEAIGERVVAQPVLALPGWFIKSAERTPVIVINGKNSGPMLRNDRVPPLSDALVKRIAFQLDARCRDVEPRAYKPLPRENET